MEPLPYRSKLNKASLKHVILLYLSAAGFCYVVIQRQLV